MMNKRSLVFLGFMLLFYFFPVKVTAQQVQLLKQGKPTSIRGLSVVDDKTAWLSGSKGYVAITVDAGKTWAWQQVKGYEKDDFRSIEAFSAKEAIIMSSGVPALILKTTDGGLSWTEKYRNADTAYFLDAMAFADAKHGLILGDPIKNKFLLLKTQDGGDTWNEYHNRPKAQPGEAAFAASGTCLRVNKKEIKFVSGGTEANFYTSNFKDDTTWHVEGLPIIKGKASQGVFSLADNHVFVGGDYANDKLSDSVACWCNDALTNIKNRYVQSRKQPSGFQSCVERIKCDIYISTGTSGTNISLDGGDTWAKIDATSFNVCRKAKHGTLVLLAGNDGKIGIFKPQLIEN